MASGKPDWNRAVTMQGWDGSNFITLLTDAQGNIISVMKGLDGATLRTLYVDGNGKMVARMQGVAGGAEQLFMMDDGGDTTDITDWTTAGDALDPVDTTVYVKEGTHAMKLGIDASKMAQDDARWYGVRDLGDMTAFQHDWIYIWIYFSTIDYLRPTSYAIHYYFGSSQPNSYQFNVTKDELQTGWNLLKFDLDNPDDSDGEIDWTAIDYQQIWINEVSGNTNDFFCVIDSINIVRPNINTGSLYDVLTDKDGLMLTRMVGSYAEIDKNIGCDRFGNMRINVSGQDNIPFGVVPYYGDVGYENGTNTDNAAETIDLFTAITGPGMVNAIDIYMDTAATVYLSSFGLKIDGVVLEAPTLKEIYDYRTVGMKDAYWQLTKYTTPRFSIRLIMPFTFKESFTIQMVKTAGAHTTEWRVSYYTF